MLTDEEKTKLANRLRRISGQVNAVGRMIDEDAYCVDTLMQISAALGALSKVGEIVLENHLKTCVSEAMQTGSESERAQKVQEVIAIFRKYSARG